MIQNLQYKQWIIRPPRMQKQKNDYDEFNMKSEYSKFSYPTSHIALHKVSLIFHQMLEIFYITQRYSFDEGLLLRWIFLQE
uniref:Ovule protein n=1 Tax=Parascaris univalens TaxID=6257 RepID=A0A915BNZ9_PARUN